MSAGPEHHDGVAPDRLHLLLEAEWPLRPAERCVYCGEPADGRICPEHQPLADLDPYLGRSA